MHTYNLYNSLYPISMVKPTPREFLLKKAVSRFLCLIFLMYLKWAN